MLEKQQWVDVWVDGKRNFDAKDGLGDVMEDIRYI
jgi:hypothetical protein